jgi:hypothetical protein
MKEAMLLADNAPSCQKGIAGHLAVLENPAGFDRLVAPVIKSPSVACRGPDPSH